MPNTPPQSWQQANHDHLLAEIHRLKQQLQAMAQPSQPAVAKANAPHLAPVPDQQKAAAKVIDTGAVDAQYVGWGKFTNPNNQKLKDKNTTIARPSPCTKC